MQHISVGRASNANLIYGLYLRDLVVCSRTSSSSPSPSLCLLFVCVCHTLCHRPQHIASSVCACALPRTHARTNGHRSTNARPGRHGTKWGACKHARLVYSSNAFCTRVARDVSARQTRVAHERERRSSCYTPSSSGSSTFGWARLLAGWLVGKTLFTIHIWCNFPRIND